MQIELKDEYHQFFRLVNDNITDHKIDPVLAMEIWQEGFEALCPRSVLKDLCPTCGNKGGLNK